MNGTSVAVNTAAGPMSDAAIVDNGSALLRHEHRFGFDFDGFAVWCIGHIVPSS